jgi:hypothetical protein
MKQLNEIKRMQQLAGINEGQAEIYPFQALPEEQVLYDKIATVLEKFINNIAAKLEIEPSNIRVSCDSLYNKQYKDKGLVVQIKSNDNKWEKPWVGNNLIIQTPNNEGITISPGLNGSGEININGSKNKELRVIFDKANDLDLDKYVADFNKKLSNSLKPEEIELIAPNTPIVVTGK